MKNLRNIIREHINKISFQADFEKHLIDGKYLYHYTLTENLNQIKKELKHQLRK